MASGGKISIVVSGGMATGDREGVREWGIRNNLHGRQRRIKWKKSCARSDTWRLGDVNGRGVEQTEKH